MGFTHYFRRKKTLETKTFNAFVEDVKVIFETAKEKRIPLANGMGEKGTLPIADAQRIHFNGVEDNSHETMSIPRILKKESYDKGPLIFSFCKTARKPYDTIVTAVLVAFKHHFPHAEISSDGENEDFESGRKICSKLFGYGSEFKLGDE